MTEFQVLDPVVLCLSADAQSQGEEEEDQKLEGVVAIIDSTAKRIGVRLTGNSVGKGNCSDKMGVLQCPPNGGIYVDMPNDATKAIIQKRPVTRLDELRLRRELGILSSSTTTTATTTSAGTTLGATSNSSSSRGASTTTINRSRIRRRQDVDAAATGGETSQRVASSTSSNPADPPASFRLPPPTETSYSSNNRNKSEGESDLKPEQRTLSSPLLNEASSSPPPPPTLEQLQKELAELPGQVKSTQERLERIKQQKEQRFQQQQQQMYREATHQQQEQPEEATPQDPAKETSSESQQEPANNDQEEPVVVETPIMIRRSDPPGRSSDVLAIQRLRAWGMNDATTVTTMQAEIVEAEHVEVDHEVSNNSSSAATSPTEANSDASTVQENYYFTIGQSPEARRVETTGARRVEAVTTSAAETSCDASTEDFMIGQSAETPRVEAITDLSSSLPLSPHVSTDEDFVVVGQSSVVAKAPQVESSSSSFPLSPLEKAEAKNNPDLSSRMNVSNCSSIGQEVSEVSFFLQTNAHILHQGINGEEQDKPHFNNLSTQMEASHSSAEKSDPSSSSSNNNNTTQQSSEGMEQVLDPWDRILLQSKGMMELDKPETVLLQAAVPQPVASIVDPWAPAPTTTNNTSAVNQSTNSVLDVSNPYGAMAPVPIPLPVTTSPDRSSIINIMDSSSFSSSNHLSMAAPTPLRSNTRSKTDGGTNTKPAAPERSILGEISSDSSQMGEMMKYILASQKAAAEEEALQKSTTNSNSLDKNNAPNTSPQAKATSEALPIHTTESTFSNLKTNERHVDGENSKSVGEAKKHIVEPQQASSTRDEEESLKSATSFTSMDNKSTTNRRHAKAASAAFPAHSTEATFADLLRKAEKRNNRKMQASSSIQSKSSFDDAATMVTIGLESTKNFKFDEKKEEESHASSSNKETPFSELKPLSINSERRSFGSSKPWSKVLNRLTDEVPEPDFRRAKSEPVTPTRTEVASVGTFSQNPDSNEGSPAQSQDSYSTSSLPKPPGLRTPFDDDHDLFPLDETGVSLGKSPIKGLEFNALMPLMTALNDSSMRPSIGQPNRIKPPDFDENSLMDNSVSSNAAVRTPKRSPTKNQSASQFGNPFAAIGNAAYSTPPRTPTAVTPARPPSKIQVSSDSPLETSSITNETATTPSRPTNGFGSPIKSPLENSVFTNGPVSTPTRPNSLQKPLNSNQDVFRGKSGQENRPRLNSSDETGSLLNATANSLYSHDNGADEKDAESFSSYAWTAPASVSESKSGDNDVFLTGTFDVESQMSTPSRIPRITLDDSFSLYSHVEEQPDSKSPTFLQLDMAGQIKEIMKNTRAKREQTRNETTKITAISPLKSPDDGYDSDKNSFVNSSSSEESESLKESAVDDEFFPEPPKRAGASRQKVIRCLAVVAAMVIGAAGAVLYGIGILDLETGESQRAAPGGQDGGTSAPAELKLELLADMLGIEEFDLVLAHVQASLDWIIENDSSEFINSLEQWQLDERFALIALYMATSSTQALDVESDWKRKRGFLTPDVSVCQWNLGGHGVFCDDQDRVIEISLDENGMTGVLPKELGRLSMMETLSLASNRITGSLPASLFELEHLFSLVLSNNQLTGDIPEYRNEALQILNLSHNYKLTGQIPESLTQRTSLKHLALLGTNIGGTIPAFVSDSGLEFLAIADSRVGGSIPSSLTSLPKLRFLYLIENALSGTVPKEYNSENIFKSGNVLQHLYLSGNELNGGIPSELKELTKLQHLGLDFNALDNILPPELGSLDSLEYLYLNSNVNFEGDLSNPELQPLLARLKELQIQNTSILLTEDSLCKSGSMAYEWDFVSSDCKPPANRVICSCCDVCCPNNAADSDNVCLSFNPSGKSILENTVW